MEHPDLTDSEYPEEKASVLAMLEQLRLDVASLDVDKIESHHLYGSRFSRVDGGHRVGAQEGRQMERNFFSSISRCDVTFDDVRIDVFEHTAVVTCVHAGEWEVGGQVQSTRVFLTLVLVQDAGAWKIAHEGSYKLS